MIVLLSSLLLGQALRAAREIPSCSMHAVRGAVRQQVGGPPRLSAGGIFLLLPIVGSSFLTLPTAGSTLLMLCVGEGGSMFLTLC